jgi:hypothetical protein
MIPPGQPGSLREQRERAKTILNIQTSRKLKVVVGGIIVTMGISVALYTKTKK